MPVGMREQPGAVRHRARGLAALWSVQSARYLAQAAFFGFIAFAAVRYAVLHETAAIRVPSPEAYCPFGGVETLYRTVTGVLADAGLRFINYARLSNLVILLAVLGTALLFKSAFCGWICPFGTLQEWLMAFSRFVQRAVPPVGRLARAVRARPWPFLVALDRGLRWLKYGVLAVILYGTITTGRMIFRDYDPYAALIFLPDGLIWPATAVLLAIVGLSLLTERPWCRYLCPLAPIVGLVGKLSPVKIERASQYCRGCNVCETACPMDLPVATASQISAVDCNNCLKCIDACPRSGALDLVLRWPWARPPVPAPAAHPAELARARG